MANKGSGIGIRANANAGWHCCYKSKLLANRFEYFFTYLLNNPWPQKLQQTGVAYLVVRDLLQVQVAAVDHLHACVAVVSAAEGAPVFRVGVERVRLLPAALRRSRGCD